MFVKLDCNIVFKSIWAEDPETCKVWITMLAMSDSDGLLEAAVTGIASVAQVSINSTQKAIDKFLAPDKLSTNQDNEGRRVERIREGYRILNYEVYRQKDHTAAARQRKHRELSRVTGVTSHSTYVSVSLSILSYLNSKRGKKYRNTKEILARLGEGRKLEDFIKIIDTKILDPYFMENPHYLNPVTLFRKSHFDNYLNESPEDFKPKQTRSNQIGAYRPEPEPEQPRTPEQIHADEITDIQTRIKNSETFLSSRGNKTAIQIKHVADNLGSLKKQLEALTGEGE